MKARFTLVLSLGLMGVAHAGVTDLDGPLGQALDQEVGAGNSGRLVGDTKTFWVNTISNSDIDLNGFVLELNTGGGNKQTYNGVFSGPGSLVIDGRSDASWFDTGDLHLSGALANTPDSVLITRGSVNLAKAAGVDALAGGITLGDTNAGNRVILAWKADNQVSDASSITTAATPFEFKMRGYSEVFGTLAIDSRGYIDLGSGSSQVHFADSSGLAWGAGDTLLIRNWGGASTNTVAFGNSATGLSADQINSVGFLNPAGLDGGLYRARILGTGEVVPDAKVEAIDPPFDLSASAMQSREQVYNIEGRANLSGDSTPLTAGMKISFFGDSITWQNGFVSRIQAALDDGAGTKELGVQAINRGINGGGVIQVRDGSTNAAYPGTSAQDGFADVIAADGADVAVVFIGINDVMWRGTTEADFRQGLQDIADQAAAADVKLVFATPTVHFEKPDGSNNNDAAIEVFSQIMREVAEEKDATLVDLRAAYMAYEKNNNWELQLDGSLIFQASGVLTYDGIHPTGEGNELLSDLISQGIYEALAVPEPGSLGLLGLGGLVIFHRHRG